MKLFLDTNILLDYLCKRDPFCKDTEILFEMFERKIHQGIISSLTIINCAYILRKFFTKRQINDTLDWLCKDFEIAEINRSCIINAKGSSAKDFEDAVQYFSALPFSPDVILTRDKHGYDNFDLLVMSPAEFIAESRK